MKQKETAPSTTEGSLIFRLRQRTSALTVDEVADIIQYSTKQVYRMVSAKRIPAYKIGGLYRFDPFKLAGWLEERQVA